MNDSDPPARPRSDQIPLERRLNHLLSGSTGITISTAESCTGGGVAHRITAVAGSSEYLIGGIVSYSNAAKARLLGVPEAILENPGAVSAECAIAMAEGSRRAFDTDIAVSTTGIAGPGGATARKPVGLVYLGLATPEGTITEEHRFTGDRGAVIDAAIQRALELVLEAAERLRNQRDGTGSS